MPAEGIILSGVSFRDDLQEFNIDAYTVFENRIIAGKRGDAAA